MKKTRYGVLLLFVMTGVAMDLEGLFGQLLSVDFGANSSAESQPGILDKKSVISCCMCLVNCTNNEELQNHFWAEHIEQPVTKCPECNQQLVWSFAITEHEKSVHPDLGKFQMKIKPRNN